MVPLGESCFKVILPALVITGSPEEFGYLYFWSASVMCILWDESASQIVTPSGKIIYLRATYNEIYVNQTIMGVTEM